MQPSRSRLEAIQKLQPPTMVNAVEDLWDGEPFEYVLSRATEAIKTNI